jgi:hypothetical protein
MKKALYSLLLLAGITVALTSCTNGDYTANPSSNANGSINPLLPLTSSQFTWSGTDPMSCDINGTHWVADAAYFSVNPLVSNRIQGIKGSDSTASEICLSLNDVWKDNLYNMGYHIYNRWGAYYTFAFGDPFAEPSTDIAPFIYYSHLGNSGEIKILTNDSASIKGQFYFQGVNSKGQVMNITNGYFNISKI